MLYFPRWQAILIVISSVLSIVYAFPNFLPEPVVKQLPSWMMLRQMPLGLDLRGGSHLLLQMNSEELRQNWLRTIQGDVRKELRGERDTAGKAERLGYGPITMQNGAVRVALRDPGDMGKVLARLKTLSQPLTSSLLGGVGGRDLDVEPDGTTAVLLKPTEAALNQKIAAAVDASLETIRRRVDALGTTEPVIQRQGRDRVLVQVPGFDDPEHLKRVIHKTAHLTFQLVDGSMPAEEAQRTRIPEGSAIYESADPQQPEPFLLKSEIIVGGEELVDAKGDFDTQNANRAVVAFRFNASGARKFAQVTRANVGRPFAIVLDNKVISAPVIQEAILGGSGIISGHFTPESANELAIQLRSGALPASLTIIEESYVGPSVGEEAIEAGKIAAVAGFILVTVLMIAGYGFFGFLSIVSLIIHLAMIMAVLSALRATLTLPGIAGLVLTMGVSVDANVLIYERIREEVRAGKSALTAIELGFTRAYATIVDSNVTGLLAAVILFWLGTGPVRGFAVTMVIGILTALFTAVTITRYMVFVWYKQTRPTVVPL